MRKLLADGVAKSCAKLRQQISRNHRPTRLARPTRPTSLSAKREAQSLALRNASCEAHNAAAYCAEQHGANRRPKLARQLFPVYFQFHVLFPFLVVIGWWVWLIVGKVLRALLSACGWDVCDAWDI